MPGEHRPTQKLVRQYFQMKAAQLRATASLAVCEHPGLVGGHREELQRVYLREILPRRFSVGRGMVYGPFGSHSHEADIVIWDSQNYPCLPMLDHSFYFAESVRLVLESKSTYSSEELNDVFTKSAALRNILTMHVPMSLTDQLQSIYQELHSLRHGIEHDGAIIVPPHIASAAVFLKGGATLTDELIDDEILRDLDERWPDLLLLLEPGRVFVKDYYHSEGPTLFVYDLEEDALLLFTELLLRILGERSSQTESPLSLFQYGLGENPNPSASLQFSTLMGLPRRVPLWRDD
jgi:Domain of unknown function (DUF6602)